MKTGHVSQGGAFLGQTKLVRQDKTANKREKNEDAPDKIDLSTKSGSAAPTVVASYEEVLELLYGIDFSQFKGAEWISKSGTSRLTELLQS